MASKTIANLKNGNRDFNNILDSFLSLSDGGTVAGATVLSSTLGVTGISTLTGGLVLGTEAITAAGAASTTVAVSLITAGSDGIAVTLANGSNVGQLKIFCSLHASNAATITPATTDGAYDTFTLTNIGETVNCIWTGTGWAIIGRNSGGAHTSATGVVGLPVFA